VRARCSAHHRHHHRHAARALDAVTSLFFDEESNEVFTGTADGLVHVWGK
jgi:hypothetical protein